MIVPPGFEPESPEIPVTDLPSVTLTDPDGDGRYEGVYKNFTLAGTYKVSIYAVGTEGNTSLPGETTVIREEKSCAKGDPDGNGSLTLADAVLVLRIVAGKEIQTECSVLSLDMSGDDKVGLAEVVGILQHVAGKRE